MKDGPLLEALTRRLAECPGEFLLEPRTGKAGVVRTAAVLSDLLEDLGGPALAPSEAAAVDGFSAPRASLAAIAAWLLHDRWFREAGHFAPLARSFLLAPGRLPALACTVAPAQCVSDPDRREELVRLALRALGLRPRGETDEQAEDRLAALDSVETAKAAEESRLRQERQRQVLEAMRKKAAAEAAAKVSRE